MLISSLLILTACGGGNYIVPISKNIKGNSKVVSVSVTKSSAINSDQIVKRVKLAIEKKAASDLKGHHPVKINVKLNRWEPAYDFNGVKTHYRGTRLIGVVTVLDEKSGAIVGKFEVSSIHIADDKTFAGTNVNTSKIDAFAYFTTYELQ